MLIKVLQGVYAWKLRDELSLALNQFRPIQGIHFIYYERSCFSLMNWETYTKEDFLDEVYMSVKMYDYTCFSTKNIRKPCHPSRVAPGVGKTFALKRLAYSIMGEKDENRIELVQFHQSLLPMKILYLDPIWLERVGFELGKVLFFITFVRRLTRNINENEYFFHYRWD